MINKGIQKQRDIWKHNSFMGHARMMQMQAVAIQQSKTATMKAKAIALNIQTEAEKLAIELKKKVDRF